ncbi:hypothetical protein HRbin40_01381 [bacterium HR40]|nr:hypothetical protein HRbin40_01381 [bacterium HR40]
MAELLVALAALFLPPVSLLVGGQPSGWPLLADAAAIAALAAGTHATLALAGSGFLVVPALASFAAAMTAATVPGALPLALATGAVLGALAGLVDAGSDSRQAAGLAAAWLAVASLLPVPAPPPSAARLELLGGGLLLLFPLLLLLRHAQAGSLAALAEIAKKRPQESAERGLPVGALRLVTGIVAGVAAGLAAMFRLFEQSLGATPPGALYETLALLAAARLGMGSLAGTIAASFWLLAVPAMLRTALPGVPLGWLVTLGALALCLAVGLDRAELRALALGRHPLPPGSRP